MLSIDAKKIRQLSCSSADLEVLERLCERLSKSEFSKTSELFNMLWLERNLFDDCDGKVFEKLLCEVFSSSGVSPIFKNGVFPFLPNIPFEFVAYSLEEGPIIFSFMERLTEDLKYFDFKSYFLKQSFKNTKSFVFTISNKSVQSISKNIQMIGINKIVDVSSSELDELILELEDYTFCLPPKIEVLKSSRVIV